MSVKLVLTQIMKNEEHVAERMLNSILPIVDAICIVDTGSTDNSIEVVKEWGEKNKIETHVFERPFDNFENSRNYSIEKAKELFLNKDNNKWHGFWLDFDEELIISDSFNKSSIKKDLYMFNTFIESMKYTRNEMYNLEKDFRFYGPVHEYLVCDDKKITSGLLEGLHVKVKMDGGSWKEDISKKYKNHALILERYIDNDRTDTRWIFYTAQSYHDSARSEDIEENRERLRRAVKYYKERLSRKDGYKEELYYSQLRIGKIFNMLEKPWKETHQELLKAYSMDPLRCESIKEIIDYYLRVGEWNNAYLYSKFAKINFHGKNPYPKRLLFVDQKLYQWKLLELHAAASFYSGKKEEAKSNYNELIQFYNNNPSLFSESDINKIKANGQFFNQ